MEEQILEKAKATIGALSSHAHHQREIGNDLQLIMRGRELTSTEDQLVLHAMAGDEIMVQLLESLIHMVALLESKRTASLN